MQYSDILFAYDDVRRGAKTRDDILAMYQAMPDPTEVFNDGNTLLHLAAQFGHASAVTYLLSQNADASAEDKYGVTPIWKLATMRAFTPLIPKGDVYAATTALLDAGASAMRKDADGNWCYLVAAKNGNGEFIKALFDKNVRLTRADEDGNNGLHLLFEALVNPMQDYQNAKKRLDEESERGGSSSHLEVQRKNAAQRKDILNYYLYITFLAAKAFLDAGVDPDDKNNMGETAHVLAQRRGANKIGALLRGEITGDEAEDDSPDAELRATAGGMTLHQAVLKRDHDAINAIVTLGSDVNSIDKIYDYGEGTALAAACRGCHYPTVKLLLELGADPNLKAGNGLSALAWLSVDPMDRQVGKVFSENWPAKILDAMSPALDINGTLDDHANTLLTWALLENNALEAFVDRETLRWLIVKAALRLGADVNRANHHGQTPLLLCGIGNDYFMKMADEIQILLLEKGADLAARDVGGNTALMYIAFNADQRKAKDMAETLFDFGDPLVDAVNNDGKSALDFATERDNEMLVKLLLNHM